MNGGIIDHMIIVEDERDVFSERHLLGARRLGWSCIRNDNEFIQQHREQRFEVVRLPFLSLKHRVRLFRQTRLELLQRGDHIGPETSGIVILRIEGKPCDRRLMAGDPSTERTGFARSRWRRDQGHWIGERCIQSFDVRCGGSGALAQSLSGGNLQKFIVGREILQEPKVLVVAQPTWGVDVGAAGFIRQQLLDLAARGVAILVISEELEELFDICDRIAVLARGKLSPVRATGETNAEEIGLFMAGLFDGRRGEPAAVDSIDK